MFSIEQIKEEPDPEIIYVKDLPEGLFFKTKKGLLVGIKKMSKENTTFLNCVDCLTPAINCEFKKAT